MKTLEQVRRSHASARPKHDNPAWLHTHEDLTFVLAQLDYYLNQVQDADLAMSLKNREIARLEKEVERLIRATSSANELPKE
jgi:hypothetical protein